MDIIHLLPDSVANQIAAGEVIQRPASCLKELVENSLDAGASEIHILVRDAGRTILQVIDNGKGMSETDARMAFERHATSKIKEAADLFELHTMGFRGEALASIAAVAQVDMLTRREEDELGTSLEINGSQVLSQEPVQCPVGTNMKVKNLFFNVPARRRFLKTDSTELRNLIYCFYRIVLVYPHVKFMFVSDDELLFDLPATTLKQRIDDVFGKNSRKSLANQLVDINADTELVKIRGFIGRPEDAQRQAQQYFFVNGRYMKHPYFHKAIMQAYSGMLQAEYAPNYFIYFDVPADSIDVNIHPTKTEIKFQDEQTIWQILLAAVRESLGKFNITPSLNFNREGDIDIPQAPSDQQKVHSPTVNYNSYNPFNRQSKQFVPQNWDTLYAGAVNSGEQTIPAHISSENTPLENGNLFIENIKDLPLSQYADKYIICPTEYGLLFIDQHRAHIAVLYDQFLAKIAARQGIKQQVLFPDVIDLSKDQAVLLLSIEDELQSVGFDISQIGPESFAIDAVPAELSGQNGVTALYDILNTLSQTGIKAKDQWQASIALSLAQSAAITQGKHLTEEEMKDICSRLFKLSNYTTTANGKKIIFILSKEEIEKRLSI